MTSTGKELSAIVFIKNKNTEPKSDDTIIILNCIIYSIEVYNIYILKSLLKQSKATALEHTTATENKAYCY